MPSATAASCSRRRREAFAEEGFDVGMAEIARRAGVGNATVFRRFPTKDALYEAIVDEKIAELVAAATLAAELADPWDALVRYLETTAELQARDRGFFQATEQHLLERPELLRRHRVVLDVVDPLVVRAQEAGVAARRRDHARRRSAWSRARSPACRPACAPTAGGARWPWCSTRCGPRRPRRCPSRRSPTRRSSVRSASPTTTDAPTPDEVERSRRSPTRSCATCEITACYSRLAAAMAAARRPVLELVHLRHVGVAPGRAHDPRRGPARRHSSASWGATPSCCTRRRAVARARAPRPVPARQPPGPARGATCTRRSTPSSWPATPSPAATARCSPRSASSSRATCATATPTWRPTRPPSPPSSTGCARASRPTASATCARPSRAISSSASSPIAGRRAQLVVLANLEIGLHEQTRLQPEIARGARRRRDHRRPAQWQPGAPPARRGRPARAHAR